MKCGLLGFLCGEEIGHLGLEGLPLFFLVVVGGHYVGPIVCVVVTINVLLKRSAMNMNIAM